MDLEAGDPYAEAVASSVRGMAYTLYSPEEVRSLSALRLTNPAAFDERGRLSLKGLYDPRLGPLTSEDGLCKTCDQLCYKCPGHFGHVELPVPLVNPLMFSLLSKILRKMCWKCHKFKECDSTKALILARLRFLSAGDLEGAEWVVKRLDVTRRDAEKREKEWTKFRQESARALTKKAPRHIRHAIRRTLKTGNQGDDRDPDNDMIINAAVAECARVQWEARLRKGRVPPRPRDWGVTVGQFLESKATRCRKCLEETVRLNVNASDRRIYRKVEGREVLVSTLEIEHQLKQLWEQEKDICEVLFGCHGRPGRRKPLDYRIFLLYTVLVPPPKFRKWSKTESTNYAAEHPQNIFYSTILECSREFLKLSGERKERSMEGNWGLPGVDATDGEAPEPSTAPSETAPKGIYHKQLSLILRMQKAMNDLYDSEAVDGGTGILQQMGGKEGIIRRHMMGKRVNYSCRSVISPDVFLETDEVGISKSFAKLITFPESVTEFNFKLMSKLVLNGRNRHPGAIGVEEYHPYGKPRSRIRFRSENSRLLRAQSSLLLQSSLPKCVLRHVNTGDRVVFNRQPTLHRSSMLGHRLRIFRGEEKMLRFHYVNCKGYNADFDGDEMNIHVPQDYLSMAEASELMAADSHYVSATSGYPIRGLIQDHILSAVLLTSRDAFLERDAFVQLLYSSLDFFLARYTPGNRRIEVPKPAILAPSELFTGKQLISTVLRVILGSRKAMNLLSSTGTNASVIGVEETIVRFQNGDLLQGVMDRNAFGSKPFGLVHAVNEVYGEEISGIFLSALGRLLTLFLRIHGHTTGVEDLILKESAEKIRSSVLRSTGLEATLNILSKVQHALEWSVGGGRQGNEDDRAQKDEEFLRTKDDAAVAISRGRMSVRNAIRREGRSMEDLLDRVTVSEVEKVGNDINGACFPVAGLRKSFPANGFALMTNTGAKGGIVNSSQISALLGQTTLEGRRVPRMGGSGRTLPAFEPFDLVPAAGGFIGSRFLTGLAPYEYFFHSMAGREGLMDTATKTAESGYLQRCLVKHLEGLRLHYDDTVRNSDNRLVQFFYGEDGLDVTKAAWVLQKPEFGLSNKVAMMPERDGYKAKNISLPLMSGNTEQPAGSKFEGTTLDQHAPGALSKLGAVSSRYESMISSLGKDVGDQEFLLRRYQQALSSPGDAVGILAALGIGEPSTQMTLNTFHFAGMGAAHVTGGIPRLVEILRRASKRPARPSMTLPLVSSAKEEDASFLVTRMSRITLLDLVESFQIIDERLGGTKGLCSYRRISLLLHFPLESTYSEKTGFDFDHIKNAVSTVFAFGLNAALVSIVSRLKKMYPSLKRFERHCFVEGVGSNKSRKELDLAGEEVASWLRDPMKRPVNYGRPSTQGKNQKTEGDPSDTWASGDSSDVTSSSDEMVDKNSDHDATDIDDKGSYKMGAHCTNASQANDGSGRAPQSDNEMGSLSDDPEKELDIRVAGGRQSKNAGISKGAKTETFDRRTVKINLNVPEDLRTSIVLTNLVRSTAKDTKLSAVPGVEKCFVRSCSDEEGISLVTEGSNLRAMWELDDLISLDNVFTNDLWEFCVVYGVEALRAALVRELTEIFKSHDVDPRHISVVADYMTQDGEFQPLNRMDLGEAASLFQRISFGTVSGFLRKAAIEGMEDSISGPSAAISVGDVYRGGTGSFDLLQAL